jgi:hypothetical protein
VQVEPPEASVGDTIRVAGANWPANAALSIMLAQRQPNGRLAVNPGVGAMRAQSDLSGQFEVQFAVPRSWPRLANSVIVVATANNRQVAVAPFSIAAPAPNTPVPPGPGPETATPVPSAATPVPAQPGQVQVKLALDTGNFRPPARVRFAVTMLNTGAGDLRNLSVWFRPSAGGNPSRVADRINVPVGQTGRATFDYAFPGPATYEVQVTIQGATGNPSDTLRVRVRGPNEPGGPGVEEVTAAGAETPASSTPAPITPGVPITITEPVSPTGAVTMTLPFPPGPTQPGQIQVRLQVDERNSHAPQQVRFTVSLRNTGRTDLTNLTVWFRPFEGGPWASVAKPVTLRRNQNGNFSFDVAFATTGTYVATVLVQGVQSTPADTIRVRLRGPEEPGGAGIDQEDLSPPVGESGQ